MLKEPLMVKIVEGDNDLKLTAGTGKSLLVKDIMIVNPTQTHLTIRIEKATVGFFRVKGVLGNHLPLVWGRSEHAHDWITSDRVVGALPNGACLENAGQAEVVAANMIGGLAAETTYPRVGVLAKAALRQKTLLGLLWDLGIFKGFPIGEGQTMTLSRTEGATPVQIVIYEVHDAGDKKPTDENGSESKEYIFINYGNCETDVAKTGDSLYNTVKSPAEFPDFPFGKDVPANTEIALLGILGSDFSPEDNDGTNWTYTERLKLIRGRVTLFDEDKKGLLFWSGRKTALGGMRGIAEGLSMIGNYSDVDVRLPLMFPVPLVFTAGEELGVYLTTLSDGTPKNIGIDEHEIGLIHKVRKLG